MGRGQYGSFDENEVIKTVHKALDLSVTVFDAAQIYGWGASEEIMGRALRGKRHDCIIATTGGLRWPDNPSLKFLERETEGDSSKEFLNKMLEGSLRRLQTATSTYS